MMTDPNKRNVVSHITNGFEHGWRESRKDEGSPWTRDLHSDYVKNIYRFWFQKTPVQIMREDMGFETTMERANEFAQASDNTADLWYYLATASAPNTGDEALKWIMAALAAEAKVRGVNFTEIPTILPARKLRRFVIAVTDGTIDRTFTKTIFAELLAKQHSRTRFADLIAEPRFKAISADDLEPIIDKIISDNPDQFEKAKTNPKLVQFFVGATMKATQGKAPPPKVIEIMTRKLAS
jgi:Asp-tRNA(Asn)/Glu-tRNA(Gln) amidotransferase B subunit